MCFFSHFNPFEAKLYFLQRIQAPEHFLQSVGRASENHPRTGAEAGLPRDISGHPRARMCQKML